MKKEKIILVLSICIMVFTTLFMVFYSNLNRNSSLSASIVTKDDNRNIFIEAAKKMVNDNIYDYEGETSISLGELVEKKYLDVKDINNNDKYNLNTVVILYVENGTINDSYIRNESFANYLSCDDICYYNENNYVLFNNDLYRIVKAKKDNVYISNLEGKEISSKDINSYINNYKNGFSKSLIYDVQILNINDVTKTDLFRKYDDIFVLDGSDYKIYDNLTKDIKSKTNKKSYIVPILILTDEVMYEMGEGTKFNPYIIN
jgi:hypothetical protein